MLLIGPIGTNFGEILIVIHIFSFKNMHLKMSSAKWRPVCLGLNVLILERLFGVVCYSSPMFCKAQHVRTVYHALTSIILYTYHDTLSLHNKFLDFIYNEQLMNISLSYIWDANAQTILATCAD